MDPKRANKEARCSKIDPNFMKIHAKSDQKTIKIHQKSMPRARPKKNNISLEKSDAWDCSWVNGFGAKSHPKWHPKIMKKSTPKKYAKMMAKGSKRDGK